MPLRERVEICSRHKDSEFWGTLYDEWIYSKRSPYILHLCEDLCVILNKESKCRCCNMPIPFILKINKLY